MSPLLLKITVWAAVAGLLAAAGLSVALYIQVKENGSLDAQLVSEQNARVTDRLAFADAIKAAQLTAKGWEDLHQAGVDRAAEQAVRDAAAEAAKNVALQASARSTQLLQNYLGSVRDDLQNCVNQPVPAAIDRRLCDASGLSAADCGVSAGGSTGGSSTP